jgi:mannose-6-phosphate isomerase-like protein (cupin superfamily)
MTLKVRRVVTGHDRSGRAIVAIDELARNIVENRPGARSAVIWSTHGFPVDNSDPLDGALRDVKTSESDGTVFRIVQYQAGVSPRVHRTESIDYAVVISGEIHMQLDESEVHLKAGDVLVQRGTVHNWVNRGTEPCVIAFVLVGARPVSVAGKTLQAHG